MCSSRAQFSLAMRGLVAHFTDEGNGLGDRSKNQSIPIPLTKVRLGRLTRPVCPGKVPARRYSGDVVAEGEEGFGRGFHGAHNAPEMPARLWPIGYNVASWGLGAGSGWPEMLIAEFQIGDFRFESGAPEAGRWGAAVNCKRHW